MLYQSCAPLELLLQRIGATNSSAWATPRASAQYPRPQCDCSLHTLVQHSANGSITAAAPTPCCILQLKTTHAGCIAAKALRKRAVYQVNRRCIS